MKSQTIRIIGAVIFLVIIVAFFSSRLALLASERENKASRTMEAESASLMENCCKTMKATPSPAPSAESTSAAAGHNCATCSKHKSAQ